MNYEKIGFKCGIEVHNRLATREKLFCGCPPKISSQKPERIIERKIRAVAGELGKIDIAAEYEYLRDRTFHYQIFSDACCLVEEDDEPPHPLNSEALQTALQVAKMLKCFIPDEIHVMRKTVIDGSNTSGFQRTAIVGMNGHLKTSLGIIGISSVSLEEESAGIVKQKNNRVVYRLDRLGIPLIEIGTVTDIKNPAHAREVAEKLGMIIRSTGKSQRGIGATRQDVNVSIKGGARVEIKGVQDLELIEKVIDGEVRRQQEIISSRSKPREETRVWKDGTTEYMRPLPGGERMYPETDIPPIEITKQMLAEIKLPETWEQKLKKFERLVPKQMAEQVLRSEFHELFEKSYKSYDAIMVANTFTSVLKDLKRRGFDTSNINESDFEKIFSAVKNGNTSKEAIPEILERVCTGASVESIIKELRPLSEQELKKIIRKIFSSYPHLVKEKRVSALMGEIMKEVRGRIDGKTVAKIFNQELENQ